MEPIIWCNYGELTDVVSLIFYCKDEESTLLVQDILRKDKSYVRFPWMKVNHGSSWKATALKLEKELMGKDDTESTTKLVYLVKTWRPEVKAQSLFHVFFQTTISRTMKNEMKALPKDVKCNWYKISEITKMWKESMLGGAEIWTIVPGIKSETDMSLFYDPSLCLISKEDNLLELTKIDVIGPNKLFDANDEHLISTCINEEYVLLLYRDFLFHSFPFILMGKSDFIKYLQGILIESRIAARIFEVSDTGGKRGVCFRELLYTIACLQPNINYNKNSLEARARFLFRYFDINLDGVIDTTELSKLISALKNNSGNESFVSTEDLAAMYKSLELKVNEPVTFHVFLEAISEMKLEGINNILKASKSISTYLESPSVKNNLARGTSKRGVDSEQLEEENESLAGSVMIGSQAVRMGKAGITSISRNVNGEKSKTFEFMENNSTFPAFNENFIGKNIVEEMLLGLSFFANPVLTNERGIKPKLSFEWGNVNNQSFAKRLLEMSKLIIPIFKSEPRLIYCSSPAYIMGDIHGNFRVLKCMEQLLWPNGTVFVPANLLFLGDIVDGGPFGVEVTAYLFALKLKSPEKVFLIRGNHETRSVQKTCTFESECFKFIGKVKGNELWESLNDAFDHMPLAAVIDKKIFCVHGGIPPPWLASTISTIDRIPCPLVNPEDSPLAWELLWNDPIKKEYITRNVETELKLNSGFANNTKRGTAHMFDESALKDFLFVNNLAMVVRAHEVQKDGYSIQYNGKLITVFSSSDYKNKIEAAVLLLQNGKIRIIQLDPDEEHTTENTRKSGGLNE